jgi:LAO/AO transport system kinase
MSGASALSDSLIERALALDKNAVSILISLFEDQRSEALSRRAVALQRLRAHPERKHAALLGLTGTPGSGKSSLLARLTPRMLELRDDISIAVLAVDPSSAVSRGALLGDRTRMRSEPSEGRLFFRSQAAATQLGGLAPSSFQVCRLLACLFDCVLIETVGVGQGEADIRHLADRVILVLQPLGGDEIQFLKAGIMEVPHAFVMNKCDEPSASTSYHTLCASLNLTRPAEPEPVPVFRTSARSGEGIDALARALLESAVLFRGQDIRSKEAHFFARWVQDEWGRVGTRQLLSALGGPARFLDESAGFEEAQLRFSRTVSRQLRALE